MTRVMCKSYKGQSPFPKIMLGPWFFISQRKRKYFTSIFILDDKITSQNPFKSAVSTLEQLSCDVSVSLSIINFSFTMLHHRRTAGESKYLKMKFLSRFFSRMYTTERQLLIIFSSVCMSVPLHYNHKF